jgi:hypothetical protein
MIAQIPWVVFFIAAVVLVAGLALIIGFKMPASFWQRQEERERLKKLLLEKELLNPATSQTKMPMPENEDKKEEKK